MFRPSGKYTNAPQAAAQAYGNTQIQVVEIDLHAEIASDDNEE
jgi:hypothetical protein